MSGLRNVLLIVLLTAAGNSAMADWIAIGSSKSNTLYIDPSTIRGTDDKTRMWALSDFKTAQHLDESEPYKSQKAEYEYNCKDARLRVLYITSYSANMAEGDIVDFNMAPGDWIQVPRGSATEALWKIACRKA